MTYLGPPVQAKVAWHPDGAWPEMRRMLTLPLTDWSFVTYQQHSLDWLSELAADSDVAARTVGLNVMANDWDPEVDLSGVFAHRPPLEWLELLLGQWNGATIANAGRCGVSRTLRYLDFSGA